MQIQKIVRTGLLTLSILIIPLIASFFVEGFNWDVLDFAVMGVMLFGAGAGYEMVASQGNSKTYRTATALALVTAFLLVWVSLAVGIIGSEDNPANTLYFVVLAVGFFGSLAVRFKARGMAGVMAVVTVLQGFVPLLAVLIYKADFRQLDGTENFVPVLALSLAFAFMFGLSAVLFREAGLKRV